jgi:hypothetical protein
VFLKVLESDPIQVEFHDRDHGDLLIRRPFPAICSDIIAFFVLQNMLVFAYMIQKFLFCDVCLVIGIIVRGLLLFSFFVGIEVFYGNLLVSCLIDTIKNPRSGSISDGLDDSVVTYIFGCLFYFFSNLVLIYHP